MRETVSAVIMTRNSARWVRGTLDSLKGWVDEIVVVDGYSEDDTVAICREYTGRIVQNRWDGYRFCTERNLGTRHASSDWCFHIDPDERATPEFRQALLKLLQSGTEHQALKFKKKNYFLGHWMKYGGWYHYSLHLFRTDRARYEGVIHERLEVDGSVGVLEAPIEHYPFESIGQFIKRHNGYSVREALALKEEGRTVSAQEIANQLKRKPLSRFFKFYVKKQGFRDGFYGLIFSILFAWVHFINWAKYWEAIQGDR